MRPTAEPVRMAVLDWLAPELAGARVLDLCAGTGAVGLEALSRGAARADFVESSPSALHALKANVARLRVRDRTRIFKKSVRVFLASPDMGVWDVVFADPPYPSPLSGEIAARWLDDPFSQVLVVEHDPERILPAPRGRGVRRHSRVVEDAALTRYRLRKR